VDFNADWRFALGDEPEAAKPQFDDGTWAAVRLPHDWAIAGPFNLKTTGRTAKLPWRGTGWYRKTFTLDASDRGKRVYLDFDGVMAFPQVYVNGQLAGQWDYGYMSFRVDATKHVKFGEKNVVAVRADTTKHGSRWYPGAGIYRKVTMTVCEPVHVAHWGTFVTTPQLTNEKATVRVRSTVENYLDTVATVVVATRLAAPDGKVVASGQREHQVPAGGSQEFDLSLDVANPQRWDVRTPQRYAAHVLVIRDGDTCDAQTTPFGIRDARFTADDGFHLNGRRVQLNGVDLHHGHGPLGAAFFPRAMERQLRIMKDMGANAIRTSHNAPAPKLLELCDRMGMLVFNECFDKWDGTADLLDRAKFEPHMARQIGNFVRRDRNHPSVIVWSIGNEIWNIEANGDGDAVEKVAFMVKQFKQHDPTRPVTFGCLVPGAVREDTHVLDPLDVTSWNYGRKYLAARERYPDKPIIYSESASALSTRGFYKLPHPTEKTDYNNPELQVDSYDLNSASGPRDIPDVDFRLMEIDRYVAGEFVWTGFDYLGEPTPFTQQARSSYFGIVDLCGMPKDRYFIYRSHWNPAATTVHILPHWNWPERVGKNVPVYVYTNGDSGELFLNGKSLGRRSKDTSNALPQDLALGRPATASSEESDRNHPAGHGNDGNHRSRWCASDDDADQWWQVDLGEVQTIRNCTIQWERPTDQYQYRIQVSDDGKDWRTVAERKEFAGTGTGKISLHECDARGRYVRVTVTKLQGNAFASFSQFAVYAESQVIDGGLPPYYRVIDRYRLRWEDVVYRPGELKAVAYRDGQKIGEAVVRTSGQPARVRLTPEKPALSVSGDELYYVLVEVLDADGVPCPLADNMIGFQVKGPARIAGIGNGNPLGFDSFTDDRHPLFHGKAMLILRAIAGKSGPIRITATGDGLEKGQVKLQ